MRNTVIIMIILRALERLLNIKFGDKNPRADMCLPVFVLALGLFLIIGSAVGIVVALIKSELIIAALLLITVALGVLAILCWRNQKINVLSDEMFEYTTFLGKTYTYNFSEITHLKKNSDSFTLYLGDKKVHIEATALLSDRLVDLINARLPEE